MLGWLARQNVVSFHLDLRYRYGVYGVSHTRDLMLSQESSTWSRYCGEEGETAMHTRAWYAAASIGEDIYYFGGRAPFYKIHFHCTSKMR